MRILNHSITSFLLRTYYLNNLGRCPYLIIRIAIPDKELDRQCKNKYKQWGNHSISNGAIKVRVYHPDILMMHKYEYNSRENRLLHELVVVARTGRLVCSSIILDFGIPRAPQYCYVVVADSKYK